MFAADATYRSSQVGAFEGRAAIEEMMRGFFRRYADAFWEVAAYRALGDDGAEFDFKMTAGPIERRGRERVWFTSAGLIRHVEIGVLDSD